VVNFCVTGALLIGFVVGLHRGLHPTRQGLFGVALLVASGCGIIGAGVFPWVMVDGVPTETPAHVVAAIAAFACTGLGLIVISRRMNADAQWHDLAGYALGTGIAVLILFVILGFFAIDDGTPLHPWAGLIQRIVLAVWFPALVVFALRLRRISTEGAGNPPRRRHATGV
jgi:hypothetical membrane protein